ncbi:amino acid permease [Lysinibacillus fusiformis]|uniref:amino acid permease n=1 Tax=Lysinibacillus fusiformis TaxID=28031 RepID=UPI000D3644CA|nr:MULTISPECIES: amino acid permease [Lysinibacillus]MED4670309.1 amino acid permease [Lysinibacillus fusiformis]QAS56567.1 amino acid permease [Lysinibacillus sphaericus]RDV30386.1 amino acid permease [Lysinibacillus fusiformis]GED65342.1 amino-acid permease AapA [Lysinibacillus fusiformis]
MEQQQLKRELKNRHVQLIAIGGTIGTGLFLGSGKAIALAGPSIILAYLIVGTALFFVMRALGELLLSNSGYTSFTDFASEYIGPWAGYVTGWTYWFCWIMTAMADIIAVGVYTQYWFDIPQWVPAIGCLVVLLLLNLLTVKLFGELEFWFAIIKVITIVALIILGLIMLVTGFQTSSGTVSVDNLWVHGGLFPNGVYGFLMAFQMVVFAFVGVELVGVSAAETADPQKNIPSAINKIPFRILLFYVGALFVILCINPWYEMSATSSPFVQVFTLAGIPIAAGIINFVVLTSAASAGNSGLFSTSRMLFNLGKNKQASPAFAKLNKNSVPSNALVISAIVVSVGALLSKLMPENAFSIATTISAICFIWVWSIIIISHIIYKRKNRALHEASSFKAPLTPFINYVVLAFFAFLLIVMFFSEATRTALLLTPIWFIVLFILYKMKKR